MKVITDNAKSYYAGHEALLDEGFVEIGTRIQAFWRF